mmetsp:Transcript_3129/g.6891  ORF Transcript_3129/g.6891 Transcript_3129/m.6891 type:complete len:822 (+) Transcript_3129:189-2654(+)|eukprot:CAMPEP_0172313962 /NCGR_PEP_ID=MMETSP1058-20130122/21354_1 /TAXON_ID=83371 /ORGANISM="Detonula confervacea, Strain CCMP 353" /LENGTH=821 /DNA_ID=CAMNT_0013027705 /DNA_START=113 /DNA_END=2578 /DNA_ORIENTATION=-
MSSASGSGSNINMPQGFAASTSPNMNMETNNPQQLSSSPAVSHDPKKALLLNGSVSLKSQMLAMSAQNNHQSAARLSKQSGQQQPKTNQLDSDVLSRMVTASGAGASSRMPIRMASMQEFRRSMNSLNTVPESSRQPRARAPNQTFDLSNRRSTLGTGHRPMASDNPLLKMMEQRMAANNVAAAEKQSPPSAALQASISKWAGMGPVASPNQSEDNKKQVHESVTPVLKQLVNDSPQTSAQGSPPCSGRVPLSSSQVDLLKELAESQHVKKDVQMSQKELLQQLFLAQVSEVGQHETSNVQQAGHYRMSNVQQAPVPYLPTRSAQPGLTRCAASSAEVDRLRRENQSIQLQQRLVMQERAMQEQMREQAYLHQRNIAVSALVSIQQNNGGQAALVQEMHNQIQVNALNEVNGRSSSELNSLAGVIPSNMRSSLRKRSSLRLEDDDESCCCSKGSLSSNTHSMTSSASSYKIHRSISHCSARSALAGSLDTIRVKSSHNLLNGSLRNQSFSSGLNVGNQSSSAGLNNMNNQSFSSGSKLSSSQFLAHQATLRRNSSSNNWIKSMLSEQNSAGKAAATFEIALQHSSQSLITPQHNQPSSLTKEKEVIMPKPIQVEAEEYCVPPIIRPRSSSSETVIVSALPDRIRYQNVKADTKPIDVVKEALSSRGAKCDTKPSIDMEECFFTNVTEMYGVEVVNAIRSNDVESLRKLSADGVNLQCGNKFGETLIHLACRRSHLDLVSFLVNDAGVSLRVRDDFGRTPMHDACWRAQPDLELLDMLLDQAPELLMLSDKRGHTPLDYARREHWAVLVPFLMERADKFRSV